ncbi:MAG: HAMP domain-containing histidine kinase [Firmicutes bacterium]|nr:HAMP domain-containing histidine kinase [Bacillota bacterium]
MSKINIIFIILSVVSISISAILILIDRYKTKNTIERLNIMLDRAISDDFMQSTYDESMMSALETKLGRFLSMSLTSKNNLTIEKDKIKALISDISHQTKTPIANILLYSQLLNEQQQLSDNCKEIINQITKQSEKLDFLIQALIKASRLETNIIAVIPKSDSTLDMVNNVYNKINDKADKKGIKIIKPYEDCIAIFDKKWTEEAIYNILDNAIKYTPEEGKITISITRYEMFCRINITDNGIGIREEDINSIFKRFYRSIDVNQYEGVGIGLYLSREIINKQSGYIKVSSILGKGSTFSVFLPR